jgi:hypothetical protein
MGHMEKPDGTFVKFGRSRELVVETQSLALGNDEGVYAVTGHLLSGDIFYRNAIRTKETCVVGE